MNSRGISRHFPFILMIVPVIYGLVIGIYPLLFLLYSALFSYDLGIQPRFVGLGNFSTLLLGGDTTFVGSLNFTFVFIVGTVLPELLLGMLAALALSSITKGKDIFIILLIMPLVTTPAVTGMIWKILFDPSFGHVNYFLSLLGFPKLSWFGSRLTATIATIIVDIWQWSPFVALIFSAGLSAIPPAPLEAARIDGAGSWTTFRHIILPHLYPLFFIVLILRTLDGIRAFDFIFVMTEGGPGTTTTTVTIWTYLNVFRYLHVGYGSAMATIIYIISLTFALLFTTGIAHLLWRK